MQVKVLLVSLVLAACATTPPQSNWALVEGCWIDASDAIPPASMVWRADPDHPGVLLGAWSVAYPGEDADVVTFTLAPAADGMRLCEHAPAAAEHCTRAILAPATLRDGDALFEVNAESLTFGNSDRPAPFFMGRRGGCS